MSDRKRKSLYEKNETNLKHITLIRLVIDDLQTATVSNRKRENLNEKGAITVAW